MKIDMSTVIAAIVAIPLVAVIFAVSCIWSGWVLHVLWAWFVVPLFGLPALTVPYAIGLSLVSKMLRGRGYSDKDESFWKSLMNAAIGPAIVLLVGWIVLKFV
jgi:hypothetical protein